jgi:hypothetical protein
MLPPQFRMRLCGFSGIVVASILAFHPQVSILEGETMPASPKLLSANFRRSTLFSMSRLIFGDVAVSLVGLADADEKS